MTIYNDASGTVVNENSFDRDFRVESDTSTHALFVDAGNNRVGVNTSSPSANFQVSGTSVLQHSGTISSQGNAQLVIRDADSTNMSANFIVEDGTNGNRGGLMIQATEVGVTNDRDIYLNPHGGRVLIGTSSGSTGQSRKLLITDSVSTYAHGPVKIENTSTSAQRIMTLNTENNGNTDMIVFDRDNGNRGSISCNGTSISYNTTSDYRLKENVIDLSGAITRVKALEPKRFNFIDKPDLTVDGFLAHEAQTVVPEAVTGTHNEVVVWGAGDELPEGVSVGDNRLDEDGNTIPKYQSIDQAKLVPLLTAALQEAITKIETLETQRADMETRLAALESA